MKDNTFDFGTFIPVCKGNVIVSWVNQILYFLENCRKCIANAFILDQFRKNQYSSEIAKPHINYTKRIRLIGHFSGCETMELFYMGRQYFIINLRVL